MTLDEELIRAIVNKEVIAAADTSVKEINMTGCWRIEDDYETLTACNFIQSRKWGRNEALAVEALIVLDLVDAVVHYMKSSEEVKIVTHMDCRKVWKLLTSKTLKVSQLAGDGGSIISKIIELENKTKAEFEHVYATMKGNEDNAIEKRIRNVVKV